MEIAGHGVNTPWASGPVSLACAKCLGRLGWLRASGTLLQRGVCRVGVLVKRMFMPWKMEYVASKETLVVAPSGWLSDAEVKQLTGEAIALLKQTQATRVLGDCRSIQSSPSFATVYWLVQDYPNYGVPRETRIALVHSAKPRAVEVAQFYETACFNRHYDARIFDTIEAAETWLGSGRTA